jgi:hypothetical protein
VIGRLLARDCAIVRSGSLVRSPPICDSRQWFISKHGPSEKSWLDTFHRISVSIVVSFPGSTNTVFLAALSALAFESGYEFQHRLDEAPGFWLHQARCLTAEKCLSQTFTTQGVTAIRM